MEPIQRAELDELDLPEQFPVVGVPDAVHAHDGFNRLVVEPVPNDDGFRHVRGEHCLSTPLRCAELKQLPGSPVLMEHEECVLLDAPAYEGLRRTRPLQLTDQLGFEFRVVLP